MQIEKWRTVWGCFAIAKGNRGLPSYRKSNEIKAGRRGKSHTKQDGKSQYWLRQSIPCFCATMWKARKCCTQRGTHLCQPWVRRQGIQNLEGTGYWALCLASLHFCYCGVWFFGFFLGGVGGDRHFASNYEVPATAKNPQAISCLWKKGSLTVNWLNMSY